MFQVRKNFPAPKMKKSSFLPGQTQDQLCKSGFYMKE
jgi:hypothetical protein